MAKGLVPIETFERNIADAQALLRYSRAFDNQRARRMRKELRERVGEALSVRARDRELLDCLESDDLFAVFKPDAELGRQDFRDLSPLLRQALVAACAALETYVADKAMEFVGSALKPGSMPRRMSDIPLTVGRWAEIEYEYERRGWGVRHTIEQHLREISSTAPNRVGEVLSTVGVKKWARAVDKARGCSSGTTERELEEITERRNRIAHSADRQGRGRAHIDVDYVETRVDIIKSVAEAIDDLLASHSP